MRIGSIDLGERPVMLAPMEDVTDISFRLMCKRFGADMVYTEFVSADALIRNVSKTQQKLAVSDDERPVAIQIYGRDVDTMVEAARICEEARSDILDINFGCPVKRVAGKGAGAGMLRNIPLMLEITREVVKAVNIPVTVKTMYTGEADWRLIGEVKRNPRMTIPIIGNGDVPSADICARRFEEFGVDGVMIGRASIGRPWVFREVKHYLRTGEPLPSESFGWYLDILKRQVEQSVERLDERRGILHIRRHLAATPLFKGIKDFKQTRIAMLRAETVAELFEIMDGIPQRFDILSPEVLINVNL